MHEADAKPRATLVVVGSINHDQIVGVAAIPAPGETVLAHVIGGGLGGKGLNQAIAATEAGAEVAFVGAVGADMPGQEIVGAMSRYGIDISSIERMPDETTGSAFVAVDEYGENVIFVTQGANGALSPDWVAAAVEAGIRDRGGALVLCQAETSAKVIEAAAMTCTSLGVRFVLNLAPFTPLTADVLRVADPLVVNRTEAEGVLAHLVGGAAVPIVTQADALVAATQLAGHSRSVVITTGADGAVIAEGDRIVELAAEKVDVVDATGAGDAYVGTLAAALVRGSSLVEAAGAGSRAAARAISRLGANSSHDVPANAG